MKDLVTLLNTPPAATEGPTGPSEGGEGTDTTPDPESPTGPSTGGVEGSEEEFKEFIKTKLAEYEPYWKPCIILYVDN